MTSIYPSAILKLEYRSAIHRTKTIYLISEVTLYEYTYQKVYVPMTETGFYILLCLLEESHGYSIVQKVESLTHGEIRLSPGTLYGSLSKMEKDGPDPIHTGRRETEDLHDYRFRKAGPGPGNETDRTAVSEYDGGA